MSTSANSPTSPATHRRSILVVDDEKNVRFSLEAVFETTFRVLLAANGDEALKIAEQESPDVAIVDLMMPGISGLELIPLLKATDPRLTVIVLSAMSDIPNVVKAMNNGAAHYLTKPFDVHEVKLIVELALKGREQQAEIQALESDISRWYNVDGVVGSSTSWQQTLSIVRRAADAPDATILLQGESGTGKELLARLAHKLSPRRSAPIIPIHCAAIPEHLLESELFGHEKGSFTGATERRCGCIEMADGGSLFLDEIGEMPPGMQSKLLRFLQDHQFMRVGGRVLRQADVRVICATNRDLKSGVADGWFRQDLFYRLNVVPIDIPPLRVRRGDIPLLINHFLTHFRSEHKIQLHHIAPDAMKLLTDYDWPGNVRELRNLVERIAVLHGHSRALELKHLPAELHAPAASSNPQEQEDPDSDLPLCLEEQVRQLERRLIRRAIEQANGNISRAAVLLQTTRRILKYKADSYGMTS